ncbi:glycosyltransferase family 47 protein [Flavobacterium algicola]|uniref:glycosyltransferase family 47 protein n=1 Tax=Flavobacterium algicola TaxID=556529 RepID=UPI001EFE57BB|nr:glycosyltransferase family 47 protein [Flavobacterium algicola]MCG9793881.1 glycosyltransferase family 47 protein [Flavobacterium algicola]
MLKLYTDPKFLIPMYRKQVFPLLFDLWYVRNEYLLEKFELVYRVEECDIAVVPIDIAHYDSAKGQPRLAKFIGTALDLGKKVWVYTAGDFGQTIDPRVNTFRTGGFHSKLNDSTFILPSFIGDPYEFLEKDFKTIPKNNKIQIGFVGNANNSLVKKIKEYLVYIKYNCKRFTKQLQTDFQPYYPSSIKRYQFLKRLMVNSNIITDFILRKKYHGGVNKTEDHKKFKLEFFQNMEHNPYVFCIRGVGNFSVRLYETLAMGRIPVVIDTDFRLPLINSINWDNHIVLVQEHSLEQQLLGFHHKISEIDFEQIQMQNRELWLKKLRRIEYFVAIYDRFTLESN